MKPRLFWTMLLAFVLVIVLGVCGMLGFFGLAVAGIWQPEDWSRSFQGAQRVTPETLADYYVAHNGSWDGVARRLDGPPFGGPAGFLGYALADDGGRVIVSSDHSLTPGSTLDADLLTRGTPVIVRGARVGTLVLLRPTRSLRPAPPAAPNPPDPAPPASFVWTLLRGFVFAGLGLGGVLLALAAFFAQRLSRPIRGITAAAQALAAGKLDTQAPGARVRELDELARAFNGMARSLAQADRQRRQMTADIAHELRTPLTIIKGRLEGLQDGIYSATPEEIERLLVETALLERLIEDLRLLALAEAGQLPLYTEILDPHDLLAAAANTFVSQAAQQGVALQIEAPDDLPLIKADPQRMSQVFANLVANALRYTPSGGSITLCVSAELAEVRSDTQTSKLKPQNSVEARSDAQTSVEARPATQTSKLKPQNSVESRSGTQTSKLKTQNSIVFQISDTGHGIAPADLPHIFDRFYRADRSRARGSGGAGLGLAIAKQIVVAHGGAIWAESVEGHGTTISIALPLVEGVTS
ncbi:MAG: ATP-binding protein [Roseiflexaceae bacterium]